MSGALVAAAVGRDGDGMELGETLLHALTRAATLSDRPSHSGQPSTPSVQSPEEF